MFSSMRSEEVPLEKRGTDLRTGHGAPRLSSVLELDDALPLLTDDGRRGGTE